MNIEAQAKLIAALADTMGNNLWASDIQSRCAQIRQALAVIEREAARRAGGER